METTLASGIEYTYSRSEIDSKIADAIEKIEKVIKENNYQVSGDIEKYYEIKWKNLSQNQMKKIQNARKEWIKARNEADRLLKIYKLEKGNFYK